MDSIDMALEISRCAKTPVAARAFLRLRVVSHVMTGIYVNIRKGSKKTRTYLYSFWFAKVRVQPASPQRGDFGTASSGPKGNRVSRITKSFAD
jgi:hypothetical protein